MSIFLTFFFFKSLTFENSRSGITIVGERTVEFRLCVSLSVSPLLSSPVSANLALSYL